MPPTPTCVIGSHLDTPHVVGAHDPDAYAEIGSLTKVLTGTVLNALADQGTLSLDDPVERWLQAPADTGITLRNLADHTSGLPRAVPGIGLFNPYRDFTTDHLDALVARLDEALTAPAGEREEYSNLGYAILGRALTVASGGDFESLVNEHVLAPLALPRDAVKACPPPRERLVATNWYGRRVKPWDMTGAILPAGGLWASTRTTARLLTGILVERALGEPALAWRRAGPLPVTYHNGATRRSSAFAAAVPDGRWVVVHRLSGSVRTTDTMGVEELRKAPPILPLDTTDKDRTT